MGDDGCRSTGGDVVKRATMAEDIFIIASKSHGFIAIGTKGVISIQHRHLRVIVAAVSIHSQNIKGITAPYGSIISTHVRIVHAHPVRSM